jgi:hypothetical protein
MKAADLNRKQYHLSVTAGMNQRYHQKRAQKWTWWNRSVQISVGIFAVLGAVLSSITPFVENFKLDLAALVVAGIAACVAVALNVLPIGMWQDSHLDLLRRWTDVREEIDSQRFIRGDKVSDEQWERLKQIDAKVHRICGSEPDCDQELLNACYAAEERSRHPATPECETAPA